MIVKWLMCMFLPAIAFCQTVALPNAVADNGGGRSTDGTMILRCSIGQTVAGFSGSSDDTILTVGFINASITETQIDENVVKPPQAFTVGNFFPNPFNSTTQITFTLPQSANVKLVVADILGKTVFETEEAKNAGSYSIKLDFSKNATSGTYLYKISADSDVRTGKINFVK